MTKEGVKYYWFFFLIYIIHCSTTRIFLSMFSKSVSIILFFSDYCRSEVDNLLNLHKMKRVLSRYTKKKNSIYIIDFMISYSKYFRLDNNVKLQWLVFK